MITCTPSRRCRALAGAVVVTATTLLSLPVVAAADPVVPGPGGDTVLIVQVDPSTSVGHVARRLPRSAVRHRFAALHALSVRVTAGNSAAEAARLRALPGVTSVTQAVTRHFYGTPNDPDFATKQAGYLDAVAAPGGWARQHGSPAVTVAVLDSGVDVDHPDLVGKVATGNRFNANDGSTDVTDTVGHGTFVAGVAAAATDNARGVAGAGYDTSLMAVKIADQDGNIQIDDEVAGIQWAVAHHADVINLSLGGSDPEPAEAKAIAAAQKAGVVVVAAAGNESGTARSYPAAYPGVLAVGATDTAHRTRADFSNYGSWVSVAAPGVGIFSTVPPTSDMWGTVPSEYAGGDGTSFSTPIVAGEAALLRAQNPHTTVGQIRHAITVSSHGYAGLGLGTGQVDFARALAHVPPASKPDSLEVDRTSGVVQLSANSTAPRVAFRIDDEPRLPSIPASGGRAQAAFATFGYRNGTHQVRAYDCTDYDECWAPTAPFTFTIANPVPAVTAPTAGATVTGLATVAGTSAAGGPLRLLIDGHWHGAALAAPYRFPLSTSALTDGNHVLQVRGCSSDGRHCAGPTSPAVTVQSAGLHPVITALSPSHVSPNRDRVRDAAGLRFRLPDREQVRVRVLDPQGATLRSYALGSLAAGSHSWNWPARSLDGRAFPDGRYRLALDTVSGRRAGWVEHAVVVDTRAPALARPTVHGRQFYPYRDGFRDTVRLTTRLGEPGRLTATIRSAAGHVVRTLRSSHASGPATITWNGRTASGHALPPGRYRAQLALTDIAGNTTRQAPVTVTISGKRLHAVTQWVSQPAAHDRNAGGTASCATARSAGSKFRRGLVLTNACSDNGFDLAFADYVFSLPPALRYGRVTFAVRGAAATRAELSAAFTRTDGSVEIPRYVTARHGSAAWFSIAGVPAAHHVNRDGRLRVSLLLDSFYAGANRFDAGLVRLRVEMTVLR